MALSFHVIFSYHYALLFRVPTWGLGEITKESDDLWTYESVIGKHTRSEFVKKPTRYYKFAFYFF